MSRRPFTGIAVLTATLSILSVTGPVSAGVGAAEQVLGGKPDQFGPGATEVGADTWVGWSQFVRPTVTAHVKIRFPAAADNRKLRRRAGSNTFFGGFEGDDAIFQEARRRNSSVYLYDIPTDTASAPPTDINTELWEWAPDISTAFILFGRNKFDRARSPWKVMLYDRVAQTFETLDSVRNRCGCIFPESVSEQYAAWTRCEGARCQVWVHDTVSGTDMKVPNPFDKQQYGAAVTDDGQVYFVRSGNGCGANPQIRRWQFGGGAATNLVHDFASGTDLRAGMDVLEGADTNDDVYFDRVNCSDRRFRGNVYRLVDANLLAPLRAPEGAAATSAPAWRARLVGARPS